MEGQEQALNLINRLDETPSWPELTSHERNNWWAFRRLQPIKMKRETCTSMLINEMLRSGKSPRGAQLLDVSQIPEGFRRTGGTTFTDPENPSFGRDLGALLSGENTGVFNLRDQDNEGLAGIPRFSARLGARRSRER